MSTVFIAGSIKIKKLHPRFVDRIANIVEQNLDIVVGDANGADTAIQSELVRQMAERVTVYCSGDEPRNNKGNWRVKRVVSTEKPGTRAFFQEKDVEMAAAADFGLMLWDSASIGTLSNVFVLLDEGKKSVVFINKDKSFLNVKGPGDILSLVAVMSDGAKAHAERKLRLQSKIRNLMDRQLELSLS